MNRNEFFSRVEWPTILLIFACYISWFSLALAGGGVPAPFWIGMMAVLTTFYWSLVHEVVHGHPTRFRWLNAAMVWLPIGWVYAFGRFRDGHLEHHATGELTDPFDDPESWYLSRNDWKESSAAMRGVLVFNNTLFGRMLVGPVIVVWRMIAGDLATIAKGGAPAIRVGGQWLLHVAGLALLLVVLVRWSPVPAWWFAVSAYLGISILLIRTFLEHQASEDAGERTVIVEDGGPLAFLFLFNNLHVVHHVRPGLAWYRLPGFYRRHRSTFLRRNRGYVYDSYWQVFRQHFLTPKEPVPHPHAK